MDSSRRFLLSYKDSVNKKTYKSNDSSTWDTNNNIFYTPSIPNSNFLEIERIVFYYTGAGANNTYNIVKGVNDTFKFTITGKGWNVNGVQAAVVGTAYTSTYTITIDTFGLNSFFYSLEDLISHINKKIQAKLNYDIQIAIINAITYEDIPTNIYLEEDNQIISLKLQYNLPTNNDTFSTFYDYEIDFRTTPGGAEIYSSLDTGLGFGFHNDPTGISNIFVDGSTFIGENTYCSGNVQTIAPKIVEYYLQSKALTRRNTVQGAYANGIIVIRFENIPNTKIDLELKKLFTWSHGDNSYMDFFITDINGNIILGTNSKGDDGLDVFLKLHTSRESLILNN